VTEAAPRLRPERMMTRMTIYISPPLLNYDLEMCPTAACAEVLARLHRARGPYVLVASSTRWCRPTFRRLGGKSLGFSVVAQCLFLADAPAIAGALMGNNRSKAGVETLTSRDGGIAGDDSFRF